VEGLLAAVMRVARAEARAGYLAQRQGGLSAAQMLPQFHHFVHATRVHVERRGDPILILASPIPEPNLNRLLEVQAAM